MTIINTQMQFMFLTIFFAIMIFWVIYRHFKKSKFHYPYQKILKPTKEPIVSQHSAIFVDLSPKSADLVELATEIWRIQNRLIKANPNLEDIQKRGLESSVQKLYKYLDRFNIKIVDHTNQKYNEGLSVDVLSFENDPSVSIPIIKETVEPTIVCEGKVVKKGKVTVIKNN